MSKEISTSVDLNMYCLILKEDVRRAMKSVETIAQGGIWSDPEYWDDAETYLKSAIGRIEALRSHLKGEGGPAA